METSAAVEASSPVETSAKARLSTRRETSCDSPMVEAAEGAGMRTKLRV